MKNILVSIILLSNSFYSSAQSYVKYIEKGKVWYSSKYDYRNSCQKYYGHVYYIAEDTIINSISYTKIKKFPQIPDYTKPGCLLTNQPKNTMVFAYVREDTLGQKVFNVQNINGTWREGLFLDFTLKKGDKVPIGNTPSGIFYSSPYPKSKGDTIAYRTVDSVYYETNGFGKSTRKIRFNVSAYSTGAYWQEGAGGQGDPSGNFFEQHTEFSEYVDKITMNNKVENGNLLLGILEDTYLDGEISFENGEIYTSLGSKIGTVSNLEELNSFFQEHNGEFLIFSFIRNKKREIKKFIVNY